MAYAGAFLVSGVLYALAAPALQTVYDRCKGRADPGVDMDISFCRRTFCTWPIGILSGALRGAGRVLVPMLLTCGGVCFFRIVWMFGVFPRYPGNQYNYAELSGIMGNHSSIVYYLLYQKISKSKKNTGVMDRDECFKSGAYQ